MVIVKNCQGDLTGTVINSGNPPTHLGQRREGEKRSALGMTRMRRCMAWVGIITISHWEHEITADGAAAEVKAHHIWVKSSESLTVPGGKEKRKNGAETWTMICLAVATWSLAWLAHCSLLRLGTCTDLMKCHPCPKNLSWRNEWKWKWSPQCRFDPQVFSTSQNCHFVLHCVNLIFSLLLFLFSDRTSILNSVCPTGGESLTGCPRCPGVWTSTVHYRSRNCSLYLRTTCGHFP